MCGDKVSCKGFALLSADAQWWSAREPGGWNRVALEVKDLPARIRELKNQAVRFRNEMGSRSRSQAEVEDPDGNPIELFEPAGR
jgi:glyoxylase I family protein